MERFWSKVATGKEGRLKPHIPLDAQYLLFLVGVAFLLAILVAAFVYGATEVIQAMIRRLAQ